MLELVAVISAAGTVVSWTQAAEALWGYSAAEVVDRPADRLLMAHDVSAATTPLGVAEPRAGRVELRQRDGRGRTVDFRVSSFRVDAAGGEWLAWEAGSVRTAPPSGLSAGVLEILFEHSPIGVALWDLDLRCTWRNEAIISMGLLTGTGHLGRRITEVVPPGHVERLEAALRQVLDSGESSLDLESVLRVASGDDEFSLGLSLSRINDAEGRTAGVCLMTVNLGGRWSRQRLGLLAEAETRIGTTLDVMHTAQELADTAVPALADFVTVELAESVMPEQEPLTHLGSTSVSIPAFYRGGVASIHPDKPEALWQPGMPVFVPLRSPYLAVMASRTSHFEPVMDTSPGTWRDTDPGRARVVRQYGMHSLMIVPLQARGELLGIASLLRTRNPVPFNERDLALAEGLAARASLSLDNARRFKREHTAALALQRDLLPHRLQGREGIEVASHYLPADIQGGVGGDWFDVIPAPRGRVALVVGDVVGHGINAAATMGRLRMVLNTLTNLELPPDQVLDRLDELVVGLARDRPADDFTSPSVVATCLYAVYDPATGRCTMASAGHPPPAVVTPDGSVAFVDVPPGAPIGVGLRDFPAVEVQLAEGSMIALYTDGLVETRKTDIDHGLERLRNALGLPAADLQDLATAVVDTMLAGERSEDDVALLLARTRILSPRART